MKIIVRGVLLILIIALLLPSGIVSAEPPRAQVFYGDVELDGSPADGVSVTAEMNGRTAGSDTASGGTYNFTLQTIEGDLAGDAIDFFVDGYDAGSTTLDPGDITQRNLSASSPLPEYTLTIDTSGGGSASGGGIYTASDDASISASPDYGWEFVNWTGDTGTIANASDPTTTITMDDDYAITANFVELPTYNLTIDITGNGSVSGDGNHPQGYEIDIGANPASGWKFDFWSGDTGTIANSSSADTTITMDDDYAITANFSEIDTFTLTMAVNGNGSTNPAAGEYEYEEGKVVDITAIPNEGWEFVNWSGDVADPTSASTTVTIEADKTVTANFSEIGVTTYTLTLAVNGNGSTNPTAGSYPYAEGTVVDISATPAEGWQFDGWVGDVASPNSSSTTVTMNANKTVTANFSIIPIQTYTLTILVSGSGNTSPAVGIYIHNEGTIIDISATAASGWLFDGWSGDVASPSSSGTTVTMDANKTVTAIFVEETVPVYTLTIIINGEGDTIPSAGSYDCEEGDIVSITATAGQGWEFDNWSGDTDTIADVSNRATIITMNSDCIITANFSREADITAPAIPVVLAANITKTGVDIFWITDEPSDSQVEYWASPGELTPLDTALTTEHLVRLTGLTPSTTYHYKVMSKDEAGNLTVSDEYTFTTTGTAATFFISGWVISIEELDSGKEVSISFLVTNSGDIAGSYQAILTINGEVEEAREITLDAGAAKNVTFTITRNANGAYQATVGGLILSFTVEPGGGGTSWWLIIAITAGVLFLAAFCILCIKKSRQKTIGNPLLEITEGTEEETYPETEETKEETKEEAKEEAEGETDRVFYGLTVTALALLKLREILQSKTTDTGKAFRITFSTSNPNQLKMIMDREKEGDKTIESEGTKLLLLGPDIIPMLEGMIIDHQTTPQGGGFTISRLSMD